MSEDKCCGDCKFSFFRESVLDVVCIRKVKVDGSIFAEDLPTERICPLWEAK